MGGRLNREIRRRREAVTFSDRDASTQLIGAVLLEHAENDEWAEQTRYLKLAPFTRCRIVLNPS